MKNEDRFYIAHLDHLLKSQLASVASVFPLSAAQARSLTTVVHCGRFGSTCASTSRTPGALEMDLTRLLASVLNWEPLIDTGTHAQGRDLDGGLANLRIK